MATEAYDATSDAELDAMIATSLRDPKTSAIDAHYLPPSNQIMVLFDNGIEIRFPRAGLEGLANATTEQLPNIVIEGGVGLAWPSINDDVAHYIPNLLDGFDVSCRVAAELGRRGGSRKSPAKTAAVRANDKKGGRPQNAQARGIRCQLLSKICRRKRLKAILLPRRLLPPPDQIYGACR